MELIFSSLVDDYSLLLEKFDHYEAIAKQQMIKSNRKLEQAKALGLIDGGREVRFQLFRFKVSAERCVGV